MGNKKWYQDFASPYYNDSHRKLRSFIRKFTGLSSRLPSFFTPFLTRCFTSLETHLTPNAHTWDEAHAIPSADYKRVADAGILAAIAAGGTGWLDDEYTKGIKVPGGVEAGEWDAFHSTFCSNTEISKVLILFAKISFWSMN